MGSDRTGVSRADRGGGLPTREWQYMESKRKEFEDAHTMVVQITHATGETINLEGLARAWGASEMAHRDYAEAYRAFFRAAQRRRA